MTNKNNTKQGGKKKAPRRPNELYSTSRGHKPPQIRDKRGNLVDFEHVGDRGSKSFWQKKSVMDIPTCSSLVREIRTNMTRDTNYRAVNHFIDNGLSGFFSANPNLVIDAMNILMSNGEVDRFDFDEVFDKVYPFSETEWVVDEDYEKYQWEVFQNMTNVSLPDYPEKGKRTKIHFSKWLETQPAVYVKSWEGKVKCYGRDHKVSFSVAKVNNRPHPRTQLTNYFVGNRALGDRPILKHLLKVPGIPNTKYIRGQPSKTNMAAYPNRKRTATERKKVRSETAPTPDDNFGEDAIARLMSGEGSISNWS